MKKAAGKEATKQPSRKKASVRKSVRGADSQDKERARDDRVFKALANRDRRTLLDHVRRQPMTTGDLCEVMEHLNRCTVMQHLDKLENAELIIVKREGKFRWNYLNVEPIQQIYSRWIADYARPASELLTRLKSELEQP